MKIQPGVGYTFDSSAKGFTFDTSEQFPNRDGAIEATHPFKIINVSINAGGNVIYQVQSGTINNIVPLLDDYISSTTVLLDRVTAGVADPPTAELTSVNYDATTLTSYIALRSGPDATTGDFPSSDVTSARYPVVIGGNDPAVADTDTAGFIFLGTITVDNVTTPTTFTVSQNVTGSLWGDRLKLGSDTARYYYARI
jgi:hypothetical protein